MKRLSKRNSLFVVALVLILPAILFSCGSKNANDVSQAKDSVFVFSTPKVLKVGEYVDNNIGTKADLTTKMKDTTDLLRLSDIADEVDYVLLKTSNGKQEVFIGGAEPRVYLSKDYIFVGAILNVVQYDRQGNLIRTIGRQGAGPGEYDYVYNLFVDDHLKRLYVICAGKINEYDFEGNFIRSRRCGYSSRLVPLDSNRIAVDVPNIWCDVKERLVILDKEGKVEKSFPRYKLFKHDEYTVGNSFDGKIPRLYKYHDLVCFGEAFNDTIFELVNDELRMRYFLDWGRYTMKQEYFMEEEYEEERVRSMAAQFYESDRYVFMKTYYFNMLTLVYDKKDDRIRVALTAYAKEPDKKLFKKIFKKTQTGFYNDYDGGMVQNIEEISLDGQYILCGYNASDVKDFFEEVGFKENPLYPEKQAKLKALVESIDENKHNLFVMISKLKK
ncbi:MAG: 6-bladed beta-propeller [Bacteroidales bacterium]|nr:6-bladed beta-propeller [Bacteroidales bacterium]MDD4822382.1 6-bladed beta-propeller [Bacteroidales bacterium]